MPKNIVIFSDGTGQDGGVRPEQVLSNVYKMYRVCRSGPDSGIAPSEQIAFYDPGLGTDIGTTAMTSPVRFAQKLLASVTGRGITTNIADCYEFLINHHQSGDRIFLIGFSRGAYTVRSLADLIRLCGIPTRVGDQPLQKFRLSTRQIAEEAVTTVLEHGAGHPRADYEDEREEQARRFREKYGSHHESCEELRSNAAPYFIGVFDTVAALGARGFRRFALTAGLAAAVAIGFGGLGAPLALILAALVGPIASFWTSFWLWVSAAAVAGSAWFWVRQRLGYRKVIRDFPNKGDVRTHRAEWKGEHFNRLLSRFVPFARSANAIDETRADFARVPWGPGPDMKREPIEGPEWFRQVWFAGNHSDVGGSYPEQESRLSDVALEWMIQQATEIPNGLRVDGVNAGSATKRLFLYPSADGVQHCEIAGMRDTLEARLPRWLLRLLPNFGWELVIRKIHEDATVHPSVVERFRLPEVTQCAGQGPYRPEALRHHAQFKNYYLT